MIDLFISSPLKEKRIEFSNIYFLPRDIAKFKTKEEEPMKNNMNTKRASQSASSFTL